MACEVAPNVSSGILCAAWQQLQVQTLLMRKQQRAMEELKQVLEVRRWAVWRLQWPGGQDVAG